METIYLEQWLHDIIRRKISEDAEYRQFAGKDRIERIEKADIDRYHLYNLRKTLTYANEKSNFYRELFHKSGVKVDDIKSPNDLARIPFTNPDDIARHPYHFACVPLGDIDRIVSFTSSGTTGPQKRVFFTGKDLEAMTDFMAAGMRSVATAGDVVQIMLPSSRPNDQADLLAKGVAKMGGQPVIAGTTPSSEEQLKLIDRFHPAILFASVSRIYRVTQETRHKNNLKSKGIKTIFVTSEYLAESMRSQLKNAWNCDVNAHYGLTEMGLGVAVECQAHNGFHFNEADLLLEVVDPKTGEVLDADEEGEIVFTALNREAMPLIRYRTHDISKLVSRPCDCGASTLKKFSRVAKRLEAIVKIGDSDEIYPALFDEIIFNIADVIDYQLTLGKAKDRAALLFKVEVTGVSPHTREAVSKAISGHPLIKKILAANRMEPPVIELVAQGTLTRLTRAKKLIIDKR